MLDENLWGDAAEWLGRPPDDQDDDDADDPDGTDLYTDTGDPVAAGGQA